MAIQPLKGLDLSISFPDGTFDNELEAVAPATQSAVFYCDAVISSSPSDGGLFEKGGSGIGIWVGWRDSGSYFRVRGGDGGASIAGGGSSTSICAVLDIPVANMPTDDQSHAIVWEVNPSSGTVKLWIDGESYGTGSTSGGGQMEGGKWEGGGSGAWGTSTTTNIPGEPTVGWQDSVGTRLYAYGSQVVDTNQVDGESGANYGDNNYGDGFYSAVKYVEASATVSASASTSSECIRVRITSSDIDAAASVTSAAERIKLAVAQKSATSSVTASANFTTNGSATVQGQTAIGTQGVRIQFVSSIVVPSSVTVASCERVRPTSADTIVGESLLAPVDFVTTAGGSADISMTSALDASGLRVREADAEVTPSATVQSSGIVVKLGEATPQASATITSVATRVRLADSSVDCASTVNANGQFTASGSGLVEGNATSTATCNRVQFSSSILAATTVTISIAREKWEPIAVTDKTWVTIPETSETWTKVA